jgi:hypothetical protein
MSGKNDALSLVPGRECGTCNVCCVALTINEPPVLQKVQGVRCRHNQADNLCAIYESRPDTCRTFFCGFRYLAWIKPTLRPDVSGVLVRMQAEKLDASGVQKISPVFMLLNRDAVRAEGFAESIAAAVMSDVPTYISIPGPPGHTASHAKVNDVLRHAVVTKDKPGVMRLLRQIYAKGRGGKREPVTFKRVTGGPGMEPIGGVEKPVVE